MCCPCSYSRAQWGRRGHQQSAQLVGTTVTRPVKTARSWAASWTREQPAEKSGEKDSKKGHSTPHTHSPYIFHSAFFFALCFTFWDGVSLCSLPGWPWIGSTPARPPKCWVHRHAPWCLGPFGLILFFSQPPCSISVFLFYRSLPLSFLSHGRLNLHGQSPIYNSSTCHFLSFDHVRAGCISRNWKFDLS